jgi:hypothetical protein
MVEFPKQMWFAGGRVERKEDKTKWERGLMRDYNSKIDRLGFGI